MENITAAQETLSSQSFPSESATMSTSSMTNQTQASHYIKATRDSTMLPRPSNDFIQNDVRACLAEQTDSQQQSVTSFERSEQENTSAIRNQRILKTSQIESESNSNNHESIFVRTPAIASTVFLKDSTAQVPRANLNDVDENTLNFTFHRSPVRGHEDCEVISLPSEISSTTYGTEYPPPRIAISESLNTATDQSAIQVRLYEPLCLLSKAMF
ncbi:unnamed protein product [Cylicocyclus nassatus]|uniref:Uncharacterized protein n=1 Tax=Cylicocyclus nassatus TaxID=53992 RepID=A0AA36GRM5_CYLNA|nr:unnamed protein product [Cylicocyclus nassatus]